LIDWLLGGFVLQCYVVGVDVIIELQV